MIKKFNRFNRPMGYIGSYQEAQKKIKQYISSIDCMTLEINHKSSLDEVKNFRSWLMSENIKKKVGIIHFLNRFTSSEQAVLLKIFEELPQYSEVLFSATSDVSYTIQTRCEIIYLSSFSNDKDIAFAMNKVFDMMRNKNLTKDMMQAWYILLQVVSMSQDDVISDKEREVICDSLGLR